MSGGRRKLYEVPRNTSIKLVLDDGSYSEVFKFHHSDGMYSVCTDANGGIVHISMNANVEIVEGS